MSEELPDRGTQLFGRSAEVRLLAQRALEKGLTFVTGRPKMGKTWILQELGRHLAYDEKQWVSDRPRFLVGYHECLGEQDQMLRAVSDLYTRWLEEADHAQQARSLWTRKSRGDWVEGTARAVGDLFEKLDPGKVVGLSLGALVKGTFEKLTAANEELKTGGLVIPKLPYETVRDLVQHLADLAGQRVVLILDGWDQSGSLDHERKLLEAYLNHLKGWPDTHVFIGLRHPEIHAALLDTPAYAAARRIAGPSADDDLSVAAKIIELKPLALAPDDTESARVLTHLRELFPKASTLADRQLLELLDGYPGTLDRWRERKDRLNNSADLLGALRQIAEDAQAYRYPEFNHYLPKLGDPERTLAIRLALILRLDAPRWEKLKPILNAGLPEDTWRRLVRARVLDTEATHPTYGHDTRHQAARRWFVSEDNLRADVRNEAEQLIVALASKIDQVDATTLPYSASVQAIAEATSLAEGSLAHTLYTAVQTLFGEAADTSLFVGKTTLIAELPQLAPLLAIALFNGVNRAKEEDDLPRRDALFAELRALHVRFSAHSPIRQTFAKALLNVLTDAKDENDLPRRDALLDELRRLATESPADAPLRETFAKALFNGVNHAKDEDHPQRRDALLDELRRLHTLFPTDTAVREIFAEGLFNAIEYAHAENRPAQRDTLLDELRRFQTQFPADAAIGEQLAGALFNSLSHARDENSRTRAFALLDELRALQVRFPTSVLVRDQVAKALFNGSLLAMEGGDLPQRDAFVDELRRLHAGFPAEAAPRKALAMALRNLLIEALEKKDPPRRDLHLDELRKLHAQTPADTGVLERFARALSDVVSYATDPDDLPAGHAALEELQNLQLRFSTEEPLLPPLLRGLLVAANQAHAAGEDDRARLLVDQLNELGSRYAEVTSVQEFFAKYGRPTARDG